MLMGRWQNFFDAFKDLHADFLGPHLRLKEEEPQWGWWNTLEAPKGQTVPSTLLRSFCPIQRISQRALELLENKAMEGWGGHQECLVSTLLHDTGYLLADIGGDGVFVPPGFQNRFYTSFSWPDGSLVHFGSMRWRPAFSFVPLWSRHALYHPVKSPPHRSKRILHAVPDFISKLKYAAPHLRTQPVSFGRALRRLKVCPKTSSGITKFSQHEAD